MTTITVIFVLSCLLALALTPLVSNIAKYYGLVDMPSARKVHRQAIPRVGGVAIYWAFFLPFASFLFYSTSVMDLLVVDRGILSLVSGASLVFGLGLWDDIVSLKPRVKFSIQSVAAMVAFWGGMRISSIEVPGGLELSLSWLSAPVTIFWFLLVINGVNLIDGLDGLAAGVSFFSSMVLLILCLLNEKYLLAMGLAAMGGACLGFLRYNFNPASIFMGDCGSYFLGYMLAALSIMGSIESHATVAILIPIIALGLPLMDTVWAPIRRFIFGRSMFQPDRDHLHHRLLDLGWGHRQAVMILYGVTICLGILALLLVNAKDDRAALILTTVGAGTILGIRKLGYLEYLTMNKLSVWLKDVTDELGVNRERRAFLSWEVAIDSAAGMDELWENVVAAAQFLGMDYIKLKLSNVPNANSGESSECTWCSENGVFPSSTLDSGRILQVTIPLGDKDRTFGCLLLGRDALSCPISPHTFRRIEKLQRAISNNLIKLSASGKDQPHTAQLEH